MNLTRRAAMGLLGAAGLAPGAFAPGRLAARDLGASAPADADPQPFFLLFDDMGADLTSDAFAAVLRPFIDRGIPVGVVLGERPILPEVTTALLNLAAESPDLAEIIAFAPDIAALPPYFQVRAAAHARQAVEDLLDKAGARRPRPPILSVAARTFPGARAVEGIRAAGFRNVILLPDGTDTPPAPRCGTLPCLGPGRRHRIVDPVDDALAWLRSGIAGKDKVMLVLSLERTLALSTEDLQARATALAQTIADAARIFAAQPRQHVRWFAFDTERLVGLRVVEPAAEDAAARSALAALTAGLRAAGHGYSLSEAGPAGALCAPLAGQPRICVVRAPLPRDDLGRLARQGIEVIVHLEGATPAGLDENGVLHLRESLTLVAGQSLQGAFAAIHPLQDVVVSLAPSAYATEEARTALLSDLQEITARTRTRCLGLPTFAAMILPADPAYRIMLATRKEPEVTAAAPLSPSEKAAFLDDARIAWRYVERLTNVRTGLCPSTASFDGKWSTFYPYLTMWDLGSLIQATLAAHELGIISTPEFRERTAALLRALPFGDVAGLTLPDEEIRTDRRAVSAPGFNLCDTGRLLSALSELDRYPASEGRAAPYVARWSLADVVRNGQLQTLAGSALVPFIPSHCTSYAARAFGCWGIVAGSPYDRMQGESQTDAQMNLLYEVARIGAIGAEPLLLEAVEMGASMPSAYLADVLFGAQTRSFARSGVLVAASETPMDRAPWFTAQGLLVDGGFDGDWDVQSIDPSPAYGTDAFKAGARIISTKAAFLWAAVRPGAYSTRLLDLVRNNARASEAGYAAGIYAATGAVMRNYSDINTNGVILQAIAYALRGHRSRTLS